MHSHPLTQSTSPRPAGIATGGHWVRRGQKLLFAATAAVGIAGLTIGGTTLPASADAGYEGDNVGSAGANGNEPEPEPEDPDSNGNRRAAASSTNLASVYSNGGPTRSAGESTVPPSPEAEPVSEDSAGNGNTKAATTSLGGSTSLFSHGGPTRSAFKTPGLSKGSLGGDTDYKQADPPGGGTVSQTDLSSFADRFRDTFDAPRGADASNQRADDEAQVGVVAQQVRNTQTDNAVDSANQETADHESNREELGGVVEVPASFVDNSVEVAVQPSVFDGLTVDQNDQISSLGDVHDAQQSAMNVQQGRVETRQAEEMVALRSDQSTTPGQITALNQQHAAEVFDLEHQALDLELAQLDEALALSDVHETEYQDLVVDTFDGPVPEDGRIVDFDDGSSGVAFDGATVTVTLGDETVEEEPADTAREALASRSGDSDGLFSNPAVTDDSTKQPVAEIDGKVRAGEATHLASVYSNGGPTQPNPTTTSDTSATTDTEDALSAFGGAGPNVDTVAPPTSPLDQRAAVFEAGLDDKFDRFVEEMPDDLSNEEASTRFDEFLANEDVQRQGFAEVNTQVEQALTSLGEAERSGNPVAELKAVHEQQRQEFLDQDVYGDDFADALTELVATQDAQLNVLEATVARDSAGQPHSSPEEAAASDVALYEAALNESYDRIVEVRLDAEAKGRFRNLQNQVFDSAEEAEASDVERAAKNGGLFTDYTGRTHQTRQAAIAANDVLAAETLVAEPPLATGELLSVVLAPVDAAIGLSEASAGVVNGNAAAVGAGLLRALPGPSVTKAVPRSVAKPVTQIEAPRVAANDGVATSLARTGTDGAVVVTKPAARPSALGAANDDVVTRLNRVDNSPRPTSAVNTAATVSNAPRTSANDALNGGGQPISGSTVAGLGVVALGTGSLVGSDVSQDPASTPDETAEPTIPTVVPEVVPPATDPVPAPEQAPGSTPIAIPDAVPDVGDLPAGDGLGIPQLPPEMVPFPDLDISKPGLTPPDGGGLPIADTPIAPSLPGDNDPSLPPTPTPTESETEPVSPVPYVAPGDDDFGTTVIPYGPDTVGFPGGNWELVPEILNTSSEGDDDQSNQDDNAEGGNGETTAKEDNDDEDNDDEDNAEEGNDDEDAAVSETEVDSEVLPVQVYEPAAGAIGAAVPASNDMVAVREYDDAGSWTLTSPDGATRTQNELSPEDFLNEREQALVEQAVRPAAPSVDESPEGGVLVDSKQEAELAAALSKLPKYPTDQRVRLTLPANPELVEMIQTGEFTLPDLAVAMAPDQADPGDIEINIEYHSSGRVVPGRGGQQHSVVFPPGTTFKASSPAETSDGQVIVDVQEIAAPEWVPESGESSGDDVVVNVLPGREWSISYPDGTIEVGTFGEKSPQAHRYLNDEQLDAINDYINEGLAINEGLRGGPIVYDADDIDKLDSALRRLPRVEGTLYRGIANKPGIEQMVASGIISDPAYQSTTTNPAVATSYADVVNDFPEFVEVAEDGTVGYVLEIRGSQSGRLIERDIKDPNDSTDEEVLFPRDTSFRIVEEVQGQTEGVRHLIVEEITNTEPDPDPDTDPDPDPGGDPDSDPVAESAAQGNIGILAGDMPAKQRVAQLWADQWEQALTDLEALEGLEEPAATMVQDTIRLLSTNATPEEIANELGETGKVRPDRDVVDQFRQLRFVEGSEMIPQSATTLREMYSEMVGPFFRIGDSSEGLRYEAVYGPQASVTARYVEESELFKFSVQTKPFDGPVGPLNPLAPRGGEMFDDAFDHIWQSAPIRGVQAYWHQGDNLKDLNENLENGMELEEAFKNTFTGTMAGRRGFTEVDSESIQDLDIDDDTGQIFRASPRFVRPKAEAGPDDVESSNEAEACPGCINDAGSYQESLADGSTISAASYDHVLAFSVKSNTPGNGRTLFNNAVDAFEAVDGPLEAIEGSWADDEGMGTNFNLFIEALSKPGTTVEEAALATRTGVWASERGFTKPNVLTRVVGGANGDINKLDDIAYVYVVFER